MILLLKERFLTALHQRMSKPEATVTLFENESPSITASRNINKVFRTRYPDRVYVELAGKALAGWREHKRLWRFYHETDGIQFTVKRVRPPSLRLVILKNQYPWTNLERNLNRT